MSKASELLGDTASARLPPPHHVKRRGQAIRARIRAPIPEPKDRESVPDIPEKYQVTKKKGEFLRFDSGLESGGKRMLIFASDKAVEMLVQCDDIFGDATFNAAPQAFYQVYVLGVLIREHLFPCVYALLPNKTKDTYIQLFEQISTITGDRMYPTNFMMDFEINQKKGVEEVFPQAKIAGCLFHLSQNILKQLETMD